MSLDVANFVSLQRYGEYFDHVTYLVVSRNLETQLRQVAEAVDWEARHGKHLNK